MPRPKVNPHLNHPSNHQLKFFNCGYRAQWLAAGIQLLLSAKSDWVKQSNAVPVLSLPFW